MKNLHWFAIAERGSTVRREILAGCTTFSAMLYIVIVNPSLLAQGGMDFSGIYVATILSAAAASLLMGLAADYPIAAAPGVGLNAYFVYGVIISAGYSWQESLGAAVLAGSIFLLLSFTSFCRWMMEAIPESLKLAIAGGIGLFVSVIGLENGKLIVGSPTTVTMLGDLSEPTAFLTLLGLFVTVVLLACRFQGALLVGMGIVFAVALGLGFAALPTAVFAWPQGLERVAGQVSFALPGSLPMVVFIMFLLLLFNTTGTLLGIGNQAGLLQKGHLDNETKAFRAAAAGSFLGSIFGSGLTVGYVESGTGTAAGGRTGLTAVVTALLFLLLLFCAPLAQVAAGVPAVTAPALILTGFFMISGVHSISWTDITEGIPAFLTIFITPLSYDILAGTGVGVISYVILKLFSGQGRKVHPMLYVLAILFALQLGLSHS